MGDVNKDTILHKHCLRYLEVLKARREQNLHEHLCHRSAEAEADRDFRLTSDERKKRDAWLDKKFKDRKREPKKEEGLSLFDRGNESILQVE